MVLKLKFKENIWRLFSLWCHYCYIFCHGCALVTISPKDLFNKQLRLYFTIVNVIEIFLLDFFLEYETRVSVNQNFANGEQKEQLFFDTLSLKCHFQFFHRSKIISLFNEGKNIKVFFFYERWKWKKFKEIFLSSVRWRMSDPIPPFLSNWGRL